jgi:hypothetical protein
VDFDLLKLDKKFKLYKKDDEIGAAVVFETPWSRAA